MNRRVHMYYDLTNKETGELVGKYTAYELSEKLHISVQTVYSAAKENRLRLGKYYIKPGMPKDFFKTWPRDCEAVKSRFIFEGRYRSGT